MVKRGRKISRAKKSIEIKDVAVTSLWKRVFAYIIDLIVISFVIFMPLKKFFSDMPEGEFEAVISYFSQYNTFSLDFFIVSFIAALLTVLYWALLEFYLSQSIGKMAMKIKVVTVDKTKLDFRKCFLRNVTKVSTFVLFLDILYGIVTRSNRRYFELITKTKVIDVENC
jgi:uncharacterized RDD family membrane protein YckC